MQSEELQMKWLKLLNLLQSETRGRGINWKPIPPSGESQVEMFRSSSRHLTYVIRQVPDAWGNDYVFEIRDDSGQVVGGINSGESGLLDSLRDGIIRLWTAITETRSQLNDILDQAISDLEPPF